jgi:hypothetical protein
VTEPLRTLNGWQRLFLVLLSVYGLWYVGISPIRTALAEQKIEDNHWQNLSKEFNSGRCKAYIEAPYERLGEILSDDLFLKRPTCLSIMAERANQKNKTPYELKVREYSSAVETVKNWVRHFLFEGVVMVIAFGVLYSLGLGVAWIRRGGFGVKNR